MCACGFMVTTHICKNVCECACVLVASRHSLTSMALTHMQRDLAASDTLPMISGWKSTCLQYWPIFFNTRSDILSLSKWTNVLMKLDSPARNIPRSSRSDNHERQNIFCQIVPLPISVWLNHHSPVLSHLVLWQLYIFVISKRKMQSSW